MYRNSSLFNLLNSYRIIGLCFIAWLSSSSAIADTKLSPHLIPAPSLLPAEVVQIQMNALRANDTPYDNAGIILTYRFASPSNKRYLKTIEQFTALFMNPDYAPMLNYNRITIGETDYQQGKALVPLTILDKRLKKSGYIFTLSKQQDGEFKDCWMTDGVTRIPLSNDNDGYI